MARVKSQLDARSMREFGERMPEVVSNAPGQERRLDRFVVKSHVRRRPRLARTRDVLTASMLAACRAG